MNRLAVETNELTRIFVEKKMFKKKREVRALDGVSIQIKEGELFGLLGPNGAGKTTLIKILTTLLLPTSGEAFVDGIDVVRNPGEVRRIINMVAGGEHSGYGILSVRETLWMFSQFYGVGGKEARKRIDELLKLVGLEKEANTRISRLSTGMRQKMNFARGFISDPKVVFLDEPTLGLDIETARTLRRFIRQWVEAKKGRTVLLTTHYMAEAEELCDRIAIINRGRILACDTPKNLKKIVQKEVVFKLEVGKFDGKIEELRSLPGVKGIVASHDNRKGVTNMRVTLQNEDSLSRVLEGITKRKGTMYLIEKDEPTLEDVFVKLVGKSIEEEDEG